MKILTIVGHQNIQFNSITSLHGSTGTAGELEANIRITDRVSAMLRERGFEVVQTDANGNDDPAITKTDFNLALSLHCDMDTSSQGGMCGSGDKSVDAMWEESLRIKKVFDEVYFKETGIKNKGYVTQGMTKWYMWQYLTPKTPCVLLEMGEIKDAHDSVLLGNTELIASGIVRSICKAFNKPYDIIPTTPPVDYEALLKSKDEQIRTLETKVANLEADTKVFTQRLSEIEAKLAENEKTVKQYQKELKIANELAANATGQLETVTADRNKYRKLYEGYNNLTGWGLIKLGISKLSIKK